MKVLCPTQPQARGARNVRGYDLLAIAALYFPSRKRGYCEVSSADPVQCSQLLANVRDKDPFILVSQLLD